MYLNWAASSKLIKATLHSKRHARKLDQHSIVGYINLTTTKYLLDQVGTSCIILEDSASVLTIEL